jgi:hypothetical protein
MISEKIERMINGTMQDNISVETSTKQVKPVFHNLINNAINNNQINFKRNI